MKGVPAKLRLATELSSPKKSPVFYSYLSGCLPPLSPLGGLLTQGAH